MDAINCRPYVQKIVEDNEGQKEEQSTSEDPSWSTAIGPKPVGGQAIAARQGAIKLKENRVHKETGSGVWLRVHVREKEERLEQARVAR